MKPIALFLAVALSGCSTLGDVATSEVTFHVCRVGDVVTSAEAFRLGADEGGPGPKSVPVIAAVSALFMVLAHKVWPDADPAGKAIMNLVSCAPVVNNIHVIRSMK